MSNGISENGLVHGVDPTRVKAVVFDLGGVFLEGTVDNVLKFGSTIGLSNESWGAIGAKLFLAGGDGAWDQLERGEITLDDFAKELQRHVGEAGVDLDMEAARNFMGSPGDSFRMRLRDEIVAACTAVKEKMPTALLTNNIIEWRDLWRSRIDVNGLFDTVIDSSEVGMRKPEERIYKFTEQQLGQPGEELLFIDDLGVNLKPARQMGWQTLKYDDTQKVLAVLEAVVKAG